MTVPFSTHFRAHPPWTCHGGTHVRGTAFIGNEMLGPEALAERFDACAGDAAAFHALLEKLNGFFAVVHVHGDKLLAAVDIIRSIPLFYGERDGRFFASDDARWVRDAVGDTARDPETEREFLLVGYVTGRDTLYARVKQIQAGELIGADKAGAVERSFHFLHLHHAYSDDGHETLLARLDAALHESFERLVRFAAGRTIAISLSGGYDSRLIALMLKRLGYPNVVCFSFGVPGNAESEVSRRVAEQLGWPWLFVPFSIAEWRAWYASNERRAHDQTADGLCSLSALGHWPAIRELTRSGALPEGCVVVPGIAADLPAGSYSVGHPELYEQARLDVDEVINHTVACHYNLWLLTSGDRDLARRRAAANFQAKVAYIDAADMFEEWFTREKVAKLVTTSIRTYEYCGLDWWLPYYDRAFVDFWLTVRPADRIGQALYAEYLERWSNALLGFHLASVKSTPLEIAKARLRNQLERTVLWPIYSLLKARRRVSRAQTIYESHPLALWGMVPFGVFTRHLGTASNLNSYLAMFYLEQGLDRAPTSEPDDSGPRQRGRSTEC